MGGNKNLVGEGRVFWGWGGGVPSGRRMSKFLAGFNDFLKDLITSYQNLILITLDHPVKVYFLFQAVIFKDLEGNE